MNLTVLQERVMSSTQFCQSALEATLRKQKWLQINAHIHELKFLCIIYYYTKLTLHKENLSYEI